jgi:hypothetical protein
MPSHLVANTGVITETHFLIGGKRIVFVGKIALVVVIAAMYDHQAGGTSFNPFGMSQDQIRQRATKQASSMRWQKERLVTLEVQIEPLGERVTVRLLHDNVSGEPALSINELFKDTTAFIDATLKALEAKLQGQ